MGEIQAQQFKAGILSAINATPKLLECDRTSIITAALLGGALGLNPSPQLGYYYLVPYGTKAQFILGYKGYIQLAIRSGLYKRLAVVSIKEGELKYMNVATEEFEIIQAKDREKLQTIGYYAMFELMSGFKKAIYYSKDKMLAYADRYSQAFNSTQAQKYWSGQIPKNEEYKYSSFWYKDFDAMAQKTMLRQLISKWGPVSNSFERAYATDTASESVTEYDLDETRIYTNTSEIKEIVDPETGEILTEPIIAVKEEKTAQTEVSDMFS